MDTRASPDPAEPRAPAGPVAFGPFVLDVSQERLLRDGQAIALKGRPLQVLALLAARPGRLVDKDEVLDAVWGHRHVTESVLKVAVNALRAALGDDAKQPRYVETVPRRGYRFVAAVLPWAPSPQAAAADLPAPAVLPPAIGNLPSQLPGLLGREAECALLARLLAAHRLVTLTGLGGIGKTRLALAVAGHDAPSDGAWLVRLESLTDGDLLVSTLAQALRLGVGAGARATSLAQALAPLRLRLVLDNAEHLVDSVAPLVAQLLAAAPGLQVLVTSQIPLQLAEEQVLLLAPLALPQAMADAAPDPAGYASAQVFCARVQRVQPGYEPRPEEHADIAAICRALDGVPLALELAAARVPILGVAGVRARLDQRFALLTQGPRDAAARHRTLGAALDWTYGLLADDERQALQLLSLSQGSMAFGAAEALLDGEAPPAPGHTRAGLDLIHALQQRSLVVFEADDAGTAPGAVQPAGSAAAPLADKRLRLFDSVRRHALDKLAANGQEAAARGRHLAWMQARFERADEIEYQVPLLEWLQPLRGETDNLRAALQHGLDPRAGAEVNERGLRLLAASAMFWARSGLKTEGLRWLQAGLALPRAGLTADLVDHAHGLFVTYTQAGVAADALAALRRTQPRWQAAGDLRRAYLSLYAQRHLHMRLGTLEEARALLPAMRALVQPSWGVLPSRHLLYMEAHEARDRGDLPTHLALCAELAAQCRRAGAVYEAWAYENAQAQALAMLERLDEACELLAATLGGIRAHGMLREQVPTLAIAASLYLRRDGRREGLALAQEAGRMLQSQGMVWWMADAWPWAAWHAGRPHDAARLQAWADAQVRARGDQRSGGLFSHLRSAFQRALLAHPDAAALQAILDAPVALDEAGVLKLALEPSLTDS